MVCEIVKNSYKEFISVSLYLWFITVICTLIAFFRSNANSQCSHCWLIFIPCFMTHCHIHFIGLVFIDQSIKNYICEVHNRIFYHFYISFLYKVLELKFQLLLPENGLQKLWRIQTKILEFISYFGMVTHVMNLCHMHFDRDFSKQYEFTMFTLLIHFHSLLRDSLSYAFYRLVLYQPKSSILTFEVPDLIF